MAKEKDEEREYSPEYFVWKKKKLLKNKDKISESLRKHAKHSPKFWLSGNPMYSFMEQGFIDYTDISDMPEVYGMHPEEFVDGYVEPISEKKMWQRNHGQELMKSLAIDYLKDRKSINTFWKPLLTKYYQTQQKYALELNFPKEIARIRDFAGDIASYNRNSPVRVPPEMQIRGKHRWMMGLNDRDESDILRRIVKMTYPLNNYESESWKLRTLLSFLSKKLPEGEAKAAKINQWLDKLEQNSVTPKKLRAVLSLTTLLDHEVDDAPLNHSERIARLGKEYYGRVTEKINELLGTEYFSEEEQMALGKPGKKLAKRIAKKQGKKTKKRPKKVLSFAEREQRFTNALGLLENLGYITKFEKGLFVFRGGDTHRRITRSKSFREKRKELKKLGMNTQAFRRDVKATEHVLQKSTEEETEKALRYLTDINIDSIMVPHYNDLREIYEVLGASRKKTPREGKPPEYLDNTSVSRVAHNLDKRLKQRIKQLKKRVDAMHAKYPVLKAPGPNATPAEITKFEKREKERVKHVWSAINRMIALIDLSASANFTSIAEQNQPPKGKKDDAPTAMEQDKKSPLSQQAYSSLSMIYVEYTQRKEELKKFSKELDVLKKKLARCKTRNEQKKLLARPENMDAILFAQFKFAHTEGVLRRLHSLMQKEHETVTGEPKAEKAVDINRLVAQRQSMYQVLTDPHAGLKEVPFYMKKEVGKITSKIEAGTRLLGSPKKESIRLKAKIRERDPKTTPFDSMGMAECTGLQEPGAFLGRGREGDNKFEAQFDHVDDPGYDIVDIYEDREYTGKPKQKPAEKPLARVYVLSTKSGGKLVPVIDSIEVHRKYMEEVGGNSSAMAALVDSALHRIGRMYPNHDKVLIHEKVSNKAAMKAYVKRNYKTKTRTVQKMGHPDHGYTNTFGDLKDNPNPTKPPKARKKFYEARLK